MRPRSNSAPTTFFGNPQDSAVELINIATPPALALFMPDKARRLQKRSKSPGSEDDQVYEGSRVELVPLEILNGLAEAGISAQRRAMRARFFRRLLNLESAASYPAPLAVAGAAAADAGPVGSPSAVSIISVASMSLDNAENSVTSAASGSLDNASTAVTSAASGGLDAEADDYFSDSDTSTETEMFTRQLMGPR